MYRFCFIAVPGKVCYSPIWRNMVFDYVRKPTNFLFNVLSGGCCRRNLFWTFAPSLPCFAHKFPSSQYISTSLSEDGQSSFCSLSSSNYISIENCVGNCFLTRGSCLYVGKNEVILLYNWLEMFRLSASAWNTEEQNPYQDSLCIL
jgi:hypothetical protein